QRALAQVRCEVSERQRTHPPPVDAAHMARIGPATFGSAPNRRGRRQPGGREGNWFVYTGTTTPVSGGAIPAPADAREDLQGDVSAASGEKDASEGSRRRAFRVADPCAGTSGSSSRGCDLPGTPSSPSELSGCGVADKAHTGFEPVPPP